MEGPNYLSIEARHKQYVIAQSQLLRTSEDFANALAKDFEAYTGTKPEVKQGHKRRYGIAHSYFFEVPLYKVYCEHFIFEKDAKDYQRILSCAYNRPQVWPIKSHIQNFGLREMANYMIMRNVPMTNSDEYVKSVRGAILSEDLRIIDGH